VWNFNDHFREKGIGDKWVALPQHFKENGYLVTGAGKIFHPGVPPNFDQPKSWSATAPDGTPWPFEDSPAGANASKTCDTSDKSLFYDHHYCLTPNYNNVTKDQKKYLQDEVVTNQVLTIPASMPLCPPPHLKFTSSSPHLLSGSPPHLTSSPPLPSWLHSFLPQVINRLNTAIDNYKKTAQPFFVAMGTHRPHL
jgi:hypothetical protein